MDLREYHPIDTYRLKVIETHDHETTEWSGSLTILTRRDGDTFIDLSFGDQPVFHLTQELDGSSTDRCVSIECQAC